MANIKLILTIIFYSIQIVSLRSIEQQNDEIVRLITPAAVRAKVRSDINRDIARANALTNHHVPHMQLVPVFRDAEGEDNIEEENSLQDIGKNTQMFRSLTNDDQQLLRDADDNPQIVRAMTNGDPQMVHATVMVNGQPQMFRVATGDDSQTMQGPTNPSSQQMRASTDTDPEMMQAMVDGRPQMFRVATEEDLQKMQGPANPSSQQMRASIDADPQMIHAMVDGRPQMFRVATGDDLQTMQGPTNPNSQQMRASTDADPQMIHAMVDGRPQMFRVATGDDLQAMQGPTNPSSQKMRASTDADPQMIHTMVDGKPQMFRVATEEDLQKMQGPANPSSQKMRASTDTDPQMIHAMVDGKPQMFRVATGADLQMMEVPASPNSQKMRASTDADPQMIHAMVDGRPQMLRVATGADVQTMQDPANPSSQKMRASADADPQMIHAMVDGRPQMFRVATGDDLQAMGGTTNPNSQKMRASTDTNPQMIHTMVDGKPQMFRVATEEDLQKMQGPANPSSQKMRASTDADPQMIHAMVDGRPQMLRVATGDDLQAMGGTTNPNSQKMRASTDTNPQMIHTMVDGRPPRFRVSSPTDATATNQETQKIRSSSNDEDQIIHAIVNGKPQMFRIATEENPQMMTPTLNQEIMRTSENDGPQMIHVMANGEPQMFPATTFEGPDLQAMRASENGDAQMIHVMVNGEPQMFRVATMEVPNSNVNPDVLRSSQDPKVTQPMFHAIPIGEPQIFRMVTNENPQNFRSLSDEDYFDVNDNDVTFMEQFPDDLLNFQTIGDENEFRKPKVMFIQAQGPLGRTVSVPATTSTTTTTTTGVKGDGIAKIITTPEHEHVKPGLKTGGPVEPPTSPSDDNFKLIDNIKKDKIPTTETPTDETATDQPTETADISLAATNETLDARSTEDANKNMPSLSITARIADLQKAPASDDVKPKGFYCVPVTDEPQSERMVDPNMDAPNNASNQILPDVARSQTFIADADVIVPLATDEKNLEPIRIEPPSAQIKHIPHVTPVHVISHEHDYENNEARTPHIVKNKFITTEFISPTTNVNQYQSQFYHPRILPGTTHTFSEASSASFQNNGGLHRVYVPSGGSSATTFAHASTGFNRFRANEEQGDATGERSGFGVQPTIKTLQADQLVAVPYLFRVPPTHTVKKRSVSENISSNSIIPIIKGIEDFFGDKNASNNILEPLQDIENFLEKHTVNERIEFEKNDRGEPIIKTEFSTNFNPQELVNEFIDSPQVNRTKRTLALVHFLTRQPSDDLLGRQNSPNEELPPIIHLRNALGSAGRAAVNVVETPLLAFFVPHNNAGEDIVGVSQNGDFQQRLSDNQEQTIQHYQNTLGHLTNAIQAQRRRYSARQNRPTGEVPTTAESQVNVRSVEPDNDDLLGARAPTRPQQMFIRPIGRAWTRMGNPTRRFYFVAQPFHPAQIVNKSDLLPTNARSVNPEIPPPKGNRKFKKVNRQQTKYEPKIKTNSAHANTIVGAEFRTNNNNELFKDSMPEIVTEPSITENILREADDDEKNEIETEIVSSTSRKSESNDTLPTKNNNDDLITISQCKELKANGGDVKVKREENSSPERLGTIQFTNFMKTPFGGMATKEQIDNYISENNSDS